MSDFITFIIKLIIRKTYKESSLYPYMPYKKKEDARLYYYRNREKRIDYQREYDKTHKEIKRAYDKKRREKKGYNKIKLIQHYSKRYFLILLKKYEKCQLCGSKENLEIHHKKYTKKLNDCMLLCRNCHKKIHIKHQWG